MSRCLSGQRPAASRAFVDTRDLMLGPRLVLDGFWEAWVPLAIARYLKPGMHFAPATTLAI